MKNKFKNQDIKLFMPERFYDIEDIVEILQERETSILVNMSNFETHTDSIDKVMHFISECQKPYAVLRVRKIFSKIFICWSEHVDC